MDIWHSFEPTAGGRVSARVCATSAVIESIKAENSESEEGMSGGSSLDVWKNGSRQVTDSTPCMIALAVVGGICIIAYLAGLLVTAVRNEKDRRLRDGSRILREVVEK